MFYDQSQFDIRCEWGIPGIRRLGAAADVLIIVDTLSFSTCVDVAISRGGIIFPYRWKDDSAKIYAVQMKAELASQRGEPGEFSLSPASMRNAEPGTRVVLPSPNGSELTVEAQSAGRVLLAGCLRNCGSVAGYAAANGRTVAVVPAGERWPDGSLRFAVEDFAAAGAIIDGLSGMRSPEASAAVALWNSIKNGVGGFLATCSSGRELCERGFAEDLQIASEVNSSQSVPRFFDGPDGYFRETW